MANYIELTIPVSEPAMREILIAELADIGYDGFQEEKSFLKAYVKKELFAEPVLPLLVRKHGLSFQYQEIEDQNWNAQWESSFEPVVVGSFCAIRAAFHEAIAGVEHEIVITPKMSFGTGHHATTYMMVEVMSGLDFQHKSVIDFGTGTGVLAILAEQCGAERIEAIDNDEWSIDNAAENILINSSKRIQLEKHDSLVVNGLFDIILANINRNVILENLPTIQQHLGTDGVVLLSGLLREDEPVIAKALELHKMVIHKKLERNSWICLQVVKS